MRKTHSFTEAKLSYDEQRAVDVAMVAFMGAAPFYAHLSHSIGRYVYTRGLKTAATDGRHIVINPAYLAGLKVPERVGLLCHEMSHLVGLHPQRAKHYASLGEIKGKPFDKDHANRAMDWVINADIVTTVPDAALNPSWLLRPDVRGDELWEDVYARTWQEQPGGKPCTAGAMGKGLRGQKGDPEADARGGAFDEILDPPVDPVTGDVDLPEANEFREAVAKAASVAKAMGQLPASLKRLVDEILEPTVSWADHIRMLIAGKIGARHETWNKPNRRRLALHPIVIMPGKRGYGAETVVVAVDTSGSIGERELAAFMGEVGGILNDCKPKRIVVLGCDSRISSEEEVTTLDDVCELADKGLGGGGGTAFEPVFEWCEENQVVPETLVYLTDGYGSYPQVAPGFPIVWAMTTEVEPPFGEVVRVKI